MECFTHFYNTDNSSSHKFVENKCYWKRTCTCANLRFTVDCGRLSDPVNGTVTTLGGTKFESLASYRCDEGYVLSYPASRTCLSSGLWSGTSPRCDPETVCGKEGKLIVWQFLWLQRIVSSRTLCNRSVNSLASLVAAQ